MNVLKELHTLVDGVDCSIARQELHAVLDELDEEQAREVLFRMRDRRYRLEKLGFVV